MRAARFHGRGDIRIDQIEEPVCGEGEVKIRPAFVGICGSDLHEYLGGPIVIPTKPHALTGGQLPVTLGHEFSGTIEEVGQGVTGLKVGDRVAVRPNLSDGDCPSCVFGRPNCCRKLGFIGFSSNAGGLSDHVAVPAKHAIPLPEGFPLDLAALVEPLTVAWHAVDRSPVETAQTAIVVGGGPIGLAVVQVLKARGVKNIIVAEVSDQRREYAQILGATHVFNPITDDVVAKVRALTNDAGADISFECSGAQAGFDTAMNGIRVRGTTTIVSLWEKKPVIDAFDVVSYEKHVIGAAICEDGDFEAVIEAIAAGKINPRPMITSKIRMEDVEEKGFKALVNEKDKHVKILIDIEA
ncbi:chaperonin 10-like protein [Aspergillus pseudoustus]|uniref:Chaperonin 10-like protein n=1 Tax=Aspergillus pseudoustus TaxID=1810923 RepID=A0ABR4JAU8_9EURO